MATNNVRGGTLTDSDCSKINPLSMSWVLSSTPGLAESVKSIIEVESAQRGKFVTRIVHVKSNWWVVRHSKP